MELEVAKGYLSPEPKWPSTAASVFAWAYQHFPPAEAAGHCSAEAPAQQQLERELAATQAELAAMHELLEDIPQIFERKFQQRLKPILEDNAILRRQLQQLQGRVEYGRPLHLPPGMRTPRITKALRHAFGLPPSRPRANWNDDLTEAA